jgi:hypothetical protein
MGWETRPSGRRYLYRSRRVDGRPVKEYLAADDAIGFGALMADDLARLQRRQATVRALTRRRRAAYRGRVDGLLAAAADQNDALRVVAEGVLCALGFHQHHRGEWRMRRELKALSAMVKDLKAEVDARDAGPLVNYQPPKDDAEAVAAFKAARGGDAAALDRVRALIKDRNWLSWLGDLGRQATVQLVRKATAGDPVWEAGVTAQANDLRARLLGADPSPLEEVLVRRVVNGWVAAHALELQLAARPPADRADREYLDRALSRAQKRMTEAAGMLARVRRLQAPQVLAQVNVAAAQTVVNAGG